MLLLLSVLINYLFGLWLQSGKDHRRLAAGLAAAANLSLLGVFKYVDFIISTINSLSGADLALTGIVLPIGISFYTFQGMSYVIDVYRHPEWGTRNPGKLLLYISFFPQLIAGPIVIYHDVADQIDRRELTPELTLSGLRRFILGLGKKMLLANSTGEIADAVFAMTADQLDFRLAWLGAVCYTLQIYFDFSGYSDMAIGLGRMFGFRFLENFDLPYTAKSIKEFWRRWHISLSSWFRDYLYIPLGGNRKGAARTNLNKFIVFFATGLWHGANWTFVLWGLWHGLFSTLEGVGAIPKRLRESRLGHVYTMLVVILGFTLFRADTLADAEVMFAGHVHRIFHGSGQHPGPHRPAGRQGGVPAGDRPALCLRHPPVGVAAASAAGPAPAGGVGGRGRGVQRPVRRERAHPGGGHLQPLHLFSVLRRGTGHDTKDKSAHCPHRLPGGLPDPLGGDAPAAPGGSGGQPDPGPRAPAFSGGRQLQHPGAGRGHRLCGRPLHLPAGDDHRRSRPDAAVFHVSAEEDVVLGQEDWLFYRETMDDYLHTNPLSEQQLFGAARTLALLQEYARSLGAQLYVTVAPNKASLYPEYLPHVGTPLEGEDDIDRLVPYLEGQGVPYIDLFAPFREEDEVLYYHTDSHWNMRGAVLAHDTLIAGLGKTDQEPFFDGPYHLGGAPPGGPL